jgi:NAD(P)-dependent dehydrogenase (short-subunit alcohol dehydrogenase family)
VTTDRGQFAAGDTCAVFGALPGSLGAAIEIHLWGLGCAVTTFGPGRVPTGDTFVNGESGEEEPVTEAVHDYEWQWGPGKRVLPDLRPYDNVVVTMGVNLDDAEDPWGFKNMEVNFHGPMALARKWRDLKKPGHFVVVSSNSAHIARSGSAAYCASKAAVSMGLRALARDAEVGVFYGWEFGLLAGTPMTRQVAERLGPDVPLTRMRALPGGIPPEDASSHVVNALRYGWREMNGCMFRVDAGEQ